MDANLIQEVIRLTNVERTQLGLSPLTLDSQLTQAAQSHSADMAHNDFFSHTGSDGSASWNRISNVGYEYQVAAENIAAGYSTAAAVVQGWMNSPGHRQNILNPALTNIGVGYVFLPDDTGETNYYHYWTQKFGARLPGTEPAETAPSASPEPLPLAQVEAGDNNANPESGLAQIETGDNSANPTAEPTPIEASDTLSPAAEPTPIEGSDNSANPATEPTPIEAGDTPNPTAKTTPIEDSDNSANPTAEPAPIEAAVNSANPETEPTPLEAGDHSNDTELLPVDSGSPDQLSPVEGDRAMDVINGDDLDNELVGGLENETIKAGAGNDVVAGGGGDDQLFGEAGDDVLRGDFNSRSSGSELDGDDLIFGGAGNDRIGGKGGDDQLWGGAGDDQIWGDDGDDLLRGGLGNDTLTGDNFSHSSGDDIFIFAAGEGADTIVDFEAGVDLIGLTDGLTFGSLSITSDGDDSLIKVNDETLAVVLGVKASELSQAAFTLV